MISSGGQGVHVLLVPVGVAVRSFQSLKSQQVAVILVSLPSADEKSKI